MTFAEYQLKEFGYEVKTTFWDDFAIAERFGGIPGVRDTYRRAFKEWKENIEYLTELSIVLNHRLWMHYNAGREALARVYDELWRKCDEYAKTNLKGEDAEYYYRITD